MKKKNIVKIFALAILVIMLIAISRVVTRTSYGADNEEQAILEGVFNKYVNYELTDGTKGTLVQYSLRTGIKYGDEFYAIKNSEINVALSPIDGKYPNSVKVISEGTKATNGRTTNINVDYSYDSNSGIATIRTSNEDENGQPIYNTRPSDNDRDEYIIISCYDTYTQDKPERDLFCNVSYKAVLFTDDNREVSGEGALNQKVTEDVGELTSIATNTSDIYNGYIKSNVINGTAYDTEYTENNEITISDKRAHQKINITEENSFVRQNDVYYKSTKILKNDILNVLGENGSLEILDGNNNVIATIDNNTEFDENGEYIVTYGDDVNSITIKTSNIINEGILHIENVKKIKSDESYLDDKDITRKVTIVGINEKEEQVNVEDTINYLQSGSLNLNSPNLNSGNVNVNTEENQGNNNVATQIVEEESYRNEKENTIEVKDATTNVEVNVDNTDWTNEKQNDVTFDISLNSSSVANNLFDNPTIRIKLPNDVEKVILGNSSMLYSNSLNMQEPYVETAEDGTTSIVVNIEGNETAYNENNLGITTNIKIPASIILSTDVETRVDKINVDYTNNYGGVEQGNIEKQIIIENFQKTQSEDTNANASTDANGDGNLVDAIVGQVEEIAKQEALVAATQEQIDGLQIKVTPMKGESELKDGDSVYEGEFIKYNVQIKNTTSDPIDNVRIVGTIPDGLKYGELNSTFGDLSTGIYEYNFDENLKETEIDVGTIKAGQTVNKYYEVQVEDLEEEKDITTNIKTYIGNTEVSDYKLNNKIKQGEVKAFLWSIINEGSATVLEEQYAYGINLDNPSGEEVTIKVKLPELFIPTQEQLDNGDVYVGAYASEYDTKIYNLGLSGVEDLGGYTYSFNGNEVIIKATKSGTYKIGVRKGDDTYLREQYSDGNAELKTVATVTTKDITYNMNENRIQYGFNNVVIEMSSDNEGEEVKYGEEINYNIAVTCTGISGIKNKTSGLYVNILDYLPENVKPQTITYDYFERVTEVDSEGRRVPAGYSEKKTKTENIKSSNSDSDGNKLPNVDIYTWIPYQETINIQIKTIAGYVYQNTEVENSAIVQGAKIDVGDSFGENEGIYEAPLETKSSNVVTHIIVPYTEEEKPEDPDTPTDPEDPDTPTDPDNPTTPSDPDAKYSISGISWNDANGDGARQDSESLISGIEVMLVDLSDSNNVKAQTTTNNGRYTFSGIEQGNYVVVFNYNTSVYLLTQYRASGVSEEINSDAMDQTITLDGQKVNVGLTDQITLNKDANNIDIGLMERQGYDLKLDKYITDVSVTTVNGTKQVSYDNTQLGRVEIRAKEIEGAQVSVKYKIVITNEGQSPATVKEIYDYLPDGLDFSNNGNTNWTNENGVLVNRGLMNQVINPGESKELTLTLTKTMGEDDAGTYTNAAEIGSAEGSITGTKDTDSTPGNRNTSEDDYSQADLIIGVSTGLAVYISIGIILFVLAVLVFLGIKFKFKIKNITKFGVSMFVFAIIGITSCSNVFAIRLHYTGNGQTSHGFTVSGGPTSSAVCSDSGDYPAAGWSGANCSDSEYAYSVSSSFSYEYGSTEVVTPGIELTKLNDKIENKKVGDRYVLGPFESSTNSNEEPYRITVYSKDGGTLSYTLCDANGNGIGSVTGTGNVTFYISLTASEFERGVSRVTATQGKTETVRQYYWKYVYAYYYYIGTNPCPTNYTGNRHQNAEGGWEDAGEGWKYEDIWTEDTIEWTNFNTFIELLKVDLDEHENGDDYERYIDIEGTLTGPNGYSESFRTTEGKYSFENLEPGTYYLTETINNNYGYEQNVEELIDLSVPTEGGKLIVYYMENTKYTGNLKIIKKDKDSENLMPNISFKLQGEGGYVVGIDANGNPIRQVTGSVQFFNMEYTSNIEDATEFITDENGEINIYNIRIGTYTVIETAINIDKYGYELDPNYIYWSSGSGSGEQSNEGQVEVVRRKSYYTTGKEGESLPSNVPAAEYDIINFENRRKWIKLSGTVWEDMISGKTSERDYVYSQGDSDENNPDRKVANVTVKLLDRNGNPVPFKTKETFNENDSVNRGTTVDEILTDADGNYLMIDVLIDELTNYYIQFTYNGMSYEPVPLTDLTPSNPNSSKAAENEAERAEFNRKYSEITHSGTTGPVGESRDDGGSKTYDLNYDTDQYYEDENGNIIGQNKSTLNYGPNSVYGYDEQKFPVNMTDEQYIMHATTKDAYQSQGQSGYLADDFDTIDNIRKTEKEEIPYINLGIMEREQPDLSLVEDIETVKVTLNGYEHTYNYNQRFENQSQYGDGFNVAVKFGNEYGSAEYTQPIYSSDVVYNAQPGNEGKLEVYVRYKIALRNEATNLYTKVNNVIVMYDNRYTIDSIQDDSGNTSYNYTDGGAVGDYNKATIEEVNQNLEPQTVKYIYVTYKLNNSAINAVLDNNEEFENNPLDAVAEIGSYSTYSDSGFSVHYAGVDKDSRPGSAEPTDRTTFEDDTDSAPAFKLELKEGRVISGTVWEDEAIADLLDLENGGTEVTDPITGETKKVKERIGNGEYEQGTENTVGNVTVDLIVLSYDANSDVDLANASILGEAGTEGTEPKESEIANLYQQGTSATDTVVELASKTTGNDGHYEFSGVIPGKYLLRFTYGNNSVIYNPDGTENRVIDDVDKYKSTIYRGNRPENESTAAGDTDWWYRSETSGENAARWSDARDEIGIDGNGKYDLLKDRLGLEREYYYGNTDPNVLNDDAIKAIEARSRGFEIKEDYDVNLDNMSKFGEELKFVFDNMDFGIIRRPIQNLKVEKQISHVKVTLANGQVLIDGDPRVDEIEHLRFLPDGNVHIEVDSEIIQGATLTVRYEIIADNSDSELDYNDENYYIFGTPDDPNSLIAPRIKRLHDYLSNDLVFDKENSPENWHQYEPEELEQLLNDQYLSQDAYDAIKKYNQVLWTDAFANMGIGRYTTELEVSKVLSNSANDLDFGNDIEVNVLIGRRTTKPDNPDDYTIPGNYVPSDDGREEGGDDDYRVITITPPTGEDLNYIPYIILGISSFIILGVGIIFIKKKVLK